MNPRLIAPAAVVALAAAVGAYVKPWESGGQEYLTPYRDVVGVWTVCDGVTGPAAQPGRTYTSEQCRALTTDEAAKHLRGLAVCVHVPLRENEWVALGSWSFNVGVTAACKSTLVRMVNAGEKAVVWCKQLLRWNRAGGRVIRGLDRRRQAEYATCVRSA